MPWLLQNTAVLDALSCRAQAQRELQQASFAAGGSDKRIPSQSASAAEQAAEMGAQQQAQTVHAMPASQAEEAATYWTISSSGVTPDASAAQLPAEAEAQGGGALAGDPAAPATRGAPQGEQACCLAAGPAHYLSTLLRGSCCTSHIMRRADPPSLLLHATPLCRGAAAAAGRGGVSAGGPGWRDQQSHGCGQPGAVGCGRGAGRARSPPRRRQPPPGVAVRLGGGGPGAPPASVELRPAHGHLAPPISRCHTLSVLKMSVCQVSL